MPIPRAHDRKPDPDEPYRYISPCCETQVHGETNTKKYRCHCGNYYTVGELIDKKGRIQ